MELVEPKSYSKLTETEIEYDGGLSDSESRGMEVGGFVGMVGFGVSTLALGVIHPKLGSDFKMLGAVSGTTKAKVVGTGVALSGSILLLGGSIACFIIGVCNGH